MKVAVINKTVVTLVFGRYLIRTSVGAMLILTDVFRDFPQPRQVLVRNVATDHDRISFLLSVHCHPSTSFDAK